MKFEVVIASIRQQLPGFTETIDRIDDSFEMDTRMTVLDGSDGKAQALNRAADDILASTDAEFYVTLDDDIVPSLGWQTLVLHAFESLPRYGAFGLWMGDSPEMQQLVGAHCLDEDQVVGATVYRRVRPPHHINGGFIAYRTEVARQIGKIPTEGVRYQLWEDAWRGRKVTKLGWEMAYLKGISVDMVEYPDPVEYLNKKQADLEFGRAKSDEVLAKSGLGDSLGMRTRKWIAKVRGRAK